MKYRNDITSRKTGRIMTPAELVEIMEMVEEAIGDDDMPLASELLYEVRMIHGYDAAHEVIRGVADCLEIASTFISHALAGYVADQAHAKGMRLGGHGYQNWLSLGDPIAA